MTGVFRFPEPRDSDLQEALQATFDVLLDARERLSDEKYATYMAIVTDTVGLEAARLAVCEALRITRQASSEAA